jgi:hypothetical protein
MAELLKAALENVPGAAVLIGIVLIAVTWIPFSVQKRGITVSNPVRITARVFLSGLGVVLIAGGVYLIITPRDDIEITQPTISEYYGYTSLGGSQSDCASGRCEMRSFGSVVFRTPKGVEARYIGRIKSGGAIKSFRTQPPHTVQNPNSYPGNPTLLDFAINPRSSGDRVLNAQGDLLVLQKITTTNGKVGHHLPYLTRLATVIVDFRPLGFEISRQVSVTVETTNSAGQLVPGLIEPVRREFADGKVILLTARDVPAGSSVIVGWGQ